MPRPYSILVVDDDPQLLDVYCAALAEVGHAVLPASDGYEAIRILVERYTDLLIADVNMPGLSGLELGAQAKLMRPCINIIYITGYHRLVERAPKPLMSLVMRKPVRPAELLTAVEKTMTAARP